LPPDHFVVIFVKLQVVVQRRVELVQLGKVLSLVIVFSGEIEDRRHKSRDCVADERKLVAADEKGDFIQLRLLVGFLYFGIGELVFEEETLETFQIFFGLRHF